MALVVTSPPYFAGKAYERIDADRPSVPASYVEYVEMLRDVFAECVRVLEPGGRIVVNIANLGRKPYRSLSADVIRVQDDLGLLLRGEVVWVKAKGAGGNCAWGSYRDPRNPVLRDVTERVVIAAKGRFDRALDPYDRGGPPACPTPPPSPVTSSSRPPSTCGRWRRSRRRGSTTRPRSPWPCPSG